MTAENTATTTTGTKHNNNNNKEEKPGLLPPQALPTSPPPPPPSSDNSSTLLSPWWSEEPSATANNTTQIEIESDSSINDNNSNTTMGIAASEIDTKSHSTLQNSNDPSSLMTINKNNSSSSSSSSSNNNTPTSSTLLSENNKAESNILNISLLSFGRSSPKESTYHWKERCILLATTEFSPTATIMHRKKQQQQESVQKELEEIFENSKECSMICFLRSSRQMTRDRLLQEKKTLSWTFAINPFYGTWITVAKTPIRCKEHLLNGNLSKKSFSDYYTMELGEEVSHTGEYVTKSVKKTFSPLYHLTQRYIDSWKQGHQQAFFSKFWTSVQKGDAICLVKDSTKRLIENVIGHDKNDKK